MTLKELIQCQPQEKFSDLWRRLYFTGSSGETIFRALTILFNLDITYSPTYQPRYISYHCDCEVRFSETPFVDICNKHYDLIFGESEESNDEGNII